MYDQQYHFIGIALGGVYARAKSKWSSSDASITIYDRRLNCYLGELTEGGVVLDKRTCKEDDIVKYAVAGAMLDCTLPDNHISNWNELKECDDMAKAGSCSFVSQNLYLDFWKNLGARVGTRKGNQIHWSDGVIQDIPEFENRWMEKSL